MKASMGRTAQGRPPRHGRVPCVRVELLNIAVAHVDDALPLGLCAAEIGAKGLEADWLGSARADQRPRTLATSAYPMELMPGAREKEAAEGAALSDAASWRITG